MAAPLFGVCDVTGVVTDRIPDFVPREGRSGAVGGRLCACALVCTCTLSSVGLIAAPPALLGATTWCLWPWPPGGVGEQGVARPSRSTCCPSSLLWLLPFPPFFLSPSTSSWASYPARPFLFVLTTSCRHLSGVCPHVCLCLPGAAALACSHSQDAGSHF